MATTAFTIYSHYDPSQREQLEIETGQIQEAASNDHGGEEEPTTVWEAEAFKARKKAPPPRFVKATMDGWSAIGDSGGTSTSLATDKNDVAGWYRSLTQTRSSSSSSGLEANGKSKATMVKEMTQKSTTPSSSLKTSTGKGKGKQPRENNWFIQKVLQQSQSDGTDKPLSSSSLADILARDPPPRPASGDKFHPPVFLALGPSNKGYALLENSGWTEGEALGPDVVRTQKEGDRKRKRGLGYGVKQARIMREVDLEGGDGEVKEVVPVIDLTVSDSSSDEGDGDGDGVAEEAMGASDDEHTSDSLQQGLKTEDSEPSVSFVASSASSSSNPIDRASARTALITPIPTILKSDRLGIGLKAKTVGPYKSSMKRITHNSAALAAHLQRAEDAKKRREKHGRGHRSFARQYKEEQRWRSDMQAYMNS
ncbi:hypothetical protein PM082_017336 [Marasmius tenuissimus]|nr:hypothetical protein PM082_017336 [Marasmius tenuissimus]